MTQVSFWEGEVRFRLVRVFGGGDGERLTCVQVREAARHSTRAWIPVVGTPPLVSVIR